MRKLVYVAVPLLALLIYMGCSKEREPTTPGPSAFAGSITCKTCHATIYVEYRTTGHPYILNKVVGGVPPVYPRSSVPNPPPGATWDGISYAVGGFGWKAVFLDLNGSLIAGDAAQYNLATQRFVEFQPDTLNGSSGYGTNCAPCHTTGYSSAGNQDNLPSINGTWSESGVTCESCHGPGSQHAVTSNQVPMTVDRSAELCGTCHTHSADGHILAAGGLIRNEGQYDEMKSAGHVDRLCVDCHAAHLSTRYDAADAIISQCADCHHMTVQIDGMQNLNCIDCHMPYSVKSALSYGTGDHLRGDMRSHIFKINTDTTEGQFYIEGGRTYSRDFNGVNFACFSASCHLGQNLQWAAENAPFVHSARRN